MIVDYTLQYGRGIRSIAEQIKSHDGPVTKDDVAEAKKLSDDFFDHYPKAKEWMEGNYEKARTIGYVEDLWGRRRRLPDASLPKYEFKSLTGGEEFNPLIGSVPRANDIPPEVIKGYTQKLDMARSSQARIDICNEARLKGIDITCNSGFIAQAERQSINAPIQGGSATMTKLAMRNMHYDPELNELDFHLLIPVHDEVIAEAPLWNIERAKRRMEEVMIHAGEPECKVAMKCDADDFPCWYYDVFSAHVKEDFENYVNEGYNRYEAYNKVCVDNSEFLPEQIKEIIEDSLQITL